MFLNDIPLNIRQLILLIRIPQRNAGMPEPVQPLPLRHIPLIVPVIKKIIMQQRTSYQIPLIAMQAQLFIQDQAVPGHAHAMVIDRHIPMLDMRFCHLEIIGMNDIIPVFLQQLMEPAIPLKMFFQPFSSPLPDLLRNTHPVIMSLLIFILYLTLLTDYAAQPHDAPTYAPLSPSHIRYR